MPCMSNSVSKLRVFLILLALLLAVVTPVVVGGYLDVARAEAAFAKGDFSKAGQYFEMAAKVLPWRPELWDTAGFSYSVARDWEHARPALAIAKRLGVLSVNSWILYGYGYCCNGVDQQSLDIWKAGLKQYPNELIFYYWAAWANRDRRDYIAERDALETWLTSGEGKAVDYYRMGQLLMASDPELARAPLQQAAALDSSYAPAVKSLQASLDLAARQPDTASRLVIIGRGLGLADDWLLAQSVLEQAVVANPQNGTAWALLGEAHQENGVEGKAELDKALALDPSSALVHGLRGVYWKRQGQGSAQLAEYQAAAQLEPTNAEWQADLGEAFALNGDSVSAFASYQKATALASDNATYLSLLALFCADNDVQVLDVGLPAARKAAQLAPSDPQVLDSLGWSLAKAGLLSDAEPMLVKATLLNPASGAAHLHLAQTYLQQGDQRSAVVELQLAYQVDAGGPAGKAAWQLLSQYSP